MTRLNIAIATLALGLAAAPSVQAQDTTRKASAGEVALVPTYATLISAINGTKGTVEQLKTMTAAVTKVHVVDAKPLVTEMQKAEFAAAKETNEADIAALRTALQGHGVVVKTLGDHEMKYATGDVIAAQLNGDDLVLFVHRKM